MSLLHWIGDTLRAQLMLVPLSVARWLFIGVMLVLMAWIVQLPASETTPPDRQSKWYEDLKIWAWIALMFQVLFYSLF
jgi:hypothetical protein